MFLLLQCLIFSMPSTKKHGRFKVPSSTVLINLIVIVLSRESGMRQRLGGGEWGALYFASLPPLHTQHLEKVFGLFVCFLVQLEHLKKF